MVVSPHYRIVGFKCDALRSPRLGLPLIGEQTGWMVPLLLDAIGRRHTGLCSLAVDADASQKCLAQLLDRLVALESLELRSVSLATAAVAAVGGKTYLPQPQIASRSGAVRSCRLRAYVASA
jgi:hypothetical protein